MKNWNFWIFLSLLCLLPWQGAARKRSTRVPVRVACVGNSITFGAGIPNREANAYPAQLQAYLGDGYEVRNFGVSGTTASPRGDHPYTATEAYRASLDFAPDIVLLKMGTNDTKPQNWKGREAFLADYGRLAAAYRDLPSHPRVVLLTPVRCFLEEAGTISPERIERDVCPAVEELAWKEGYDIVRLTDLFGDRWDAALMPDRLHPSAIGAGLMARRIGQYVRRMAAAARPRPLRTLRDARPFCFHGFEGYDFETDGVACKLVRPRHEAPGRPWVLRARFWDHEPQTDIALLEQGFHVAYCDVADGYGAPRYLDRWDAFYKRMRRAGLSRRVVLEGMSRGGLAVYNWAARHPRRVACIYADAPVLDIASWPLGRGASAGSAPDVARLLAAYGFADETEALAWRSNPLDHAERIARAGIACLHVVGDADSVVPVAENTARFEAALRRYGGDLRVIHKPGVGHHPHSLADPSPIVRFILRATDRLPDDAVRPVPGNEYRSGAGWAKGAEWHAVANDITATLAGQQLRLLLLGNSIAQGCGGGRKLVTYRPGQAAMDSAFGAGTWESAGVSGDRTQNLLWRLEQGHYADCRPENVVIAIGVNNLLSDGQYPEEVAAGIVAVTAAAERCFPRSRIVVLGLLPAGTEGSDLRRRSLDVLERLRRHRFGRAEFVDPAPWFLDAAGHLREGLYSGDAIHLTPAGYAVLARRLSAVLAQP